MTKGIKKQTDWEVIEADYAAGIKSVRAIASENGITDGAIRKKAKAKGWERNLSQKIRDKAQAELMKEAVRTEAVRTGGTHKNKITEKDTVEANATVQANIIREHRGDITRFRALTLSLLEELEGVTGFKDMMVDVGTMMQGEGDMDADKLKALYKRVIDSPSRIDSNKKLADTLKTLIGLERQAFSLDDADKNSDKCMVVIPD